MSRAGGQFLAILALPEVDSNMEALNLIPSYQPIPLPAPVWLLQLLLVLGFFLHAVPMNVVLGGGFISAACLYAGREDRQGKVYRMGKALATSLPLFISFAITQGIVPLLFLQLLYGPMFYTSSVLMAVPWLAVIGLLIIAYYMSYWTIYKYLKPKNPEAPDRSAMAPAVLLVMALIFLGVAYLFVTNMTLMLHPERWMDLYRASAHGMNLPGMDLSTIARFSHFVLAGFAVTGLAIGSFGLGINTRDEEFSSWLIKKGSTIYLIVTLVQIFVGAWFLVSLPKEFMLNFMGKEIIGTASFGASMLFMVLSLVGTGLSSTNASPKAFTGGLVTALLTVLSMVVMRHQLRIYHLDPFIHPETLPVSTQWDLLIVFIISAVLLIAYLTWLGSLVWKANMKRETAS